MKYGQCRQIEYFSRKKNEKNSECYQNPLKLGVNQLQSTEHRVFVVG